MPGHQLAELLCVYAFHLVTSRIGQDGFPVPQAPGLIKCSEVLLRNIYLALAKFMLLLLDLVCLFRS